MVSFRGFLHSPFDRYFYPDPRGSNASNSHLGYFRTLLIRKCHPRCAESGNRSASVVQWCLVRPLCPYSPECVEGVFSEVRIRGSLGGIMLTVVTGVLPLKGSGVGKENTRVGAGDGGWGSPVARATQGRIGRKDLRKLHRVHGDLKHLRR